MLDNLSIPEDEIEELFPTIRLLKEDLIAAQTMTKRELRFMVDSYYQAQKNRKTSANRVRSMADEPHTIYSRILNEQAQMEKQIAKTLDAYTAHHPLGIWMREIPGMGPITTAGLLAYIKIEESPTVGHIWAYAGFAADGQKPWLSGQLRPWNATLKTICWNIGEGFVKQSNNPDCIYGTLYKKRKIYETQNNEAGLLKHRAEEALKKKKYSHDTEAYKAYIAGKLPLAQIHARSRRYATKLFLADLHAVWYKWAFHKEPPLPYPIAHLNHAHIHQIEHVTNPQLSMTIEEYDEFYPAILTTNHKPARIKKPKESEILDLGDLDL